MESQSRDRVHESRESHDTDVYTEVGYDQPWKNFSRVDSDTSLPPAPPDLNEHHEQDSDAIPAEGPLDHRGSPGIRRSGQKFSGIPRRRYSGNVQPIIQEEEHFQMDFGNYSEQQESHFLGKVQPVIHEDEHFQMHFDDYSEQHESHFPPLPPDQDEHRGVAPNSFWDDHVAPPDEAPQIHLITRPAPPTQTWEPKHCWNDLADTSEVPPAPHAWQDAPDMPAFGERVVSRLDTSSSLHGSNDLDQVRSSPRDLGGEEQDSSIMVSEFDASSSPCGSKDINQTRPKPRHTVAAKCNLEAIDRAGSRCPPSREWTPGQRFSMQDIAVTVAGHLRGKSKRSSRTTATKSMQSWCCGLCCCRRFCRCRCCYCCPRRFCEQKRASALAMMFSLGFAVLLSWLLWTTVDPSIAEGGFGLMIQTDREEILNMQYFHEVKSAATAYLKSSQADMRSDPSESSNIAGNPTGLGDGRWWAHVELIFFVQGGNLVTTSRLQEVHRAEQSIRQLPGWQQLCNKVPEKQRYYCSPGETLANVAFGQEVTASAEAEKQRVMSEVKFNGQGQQFVMPVPSLLTYLQDFRSAAYRRWLVDESQGDVKDSPVRSLFSFYLSDDDKTLWEAFVRDDLELAIEELIAKAERQQETEGEVMHIFYRISRLDSKEFEHAVQADITYTYFVTVAALVATFVTTRRFLLGIAAMVLAITSQTMASAVLATQGLHGRSNAYAAISVGSWFLTTVNCTDLAIASACAWNSSLRYRPQGQDVKSWLLFTCSLGRFLVEVPGPMLGQAAALLISGSLVHVPLYTEFTQHSGISIAIALFLAEVIFPPAIELGDKLNQKSVKSQAAMHCVRMMLGLAPYELGGSYWCCQMGRTFSKRFVNTFRSRTVRGVSLLALLTVTLGVLFSVPPIGPQLQYDWTTPYLFSENHRLRLAPQIRARFGIALPGPSEPPAVAVQSARMCYLDAHDNAACSWMRCDREELTVAQSSSCRCVYQSTAPFSTIGTCGGAARFSGSGSREFAKQHFWSLLEVELGAEVDNSTVSVAPMSAFLEIEDWAAGTAATLPQLEVKFRKSDSSVLLWEDACFKAICNCGLWQCLIEGDDWIRLVDYEMPSSVNRRLSFDHERDYLEESLREHSDSPHVIGTLPRTPDRTWKRRTMAVGTIFAVWGLQKIATIPSRSVLTKPSFDASFDIASPWAQRSIFRSCDGPAPALGVLSTKCWALDFKRWLAGHGEVFPLRPNEFYKHFEQFTVDMDKSLKFGSAAGLAEASYNYFWIDASGLVKGCYASFDVEVPHSGLKDYTAQWISHMGSRTNQGGGGPWLTSDLFADSSSMDDMQVATNTVILSVIFCTAISVLLLTCSCGLMLVSVVVLIFTFGLSVCLVLGAEQQPIGVMEVIALAAFMTSFITPVVRVLQQYSLAHEMPRTKGKRAEKQQKQELKGRPSQSGTSSWHTTNSKHSRFTQGWEGNHRMVEFLSMDSALETYLVDNQFLQAPTQGLGYRLSPILQDLDKTPNVQQCMAQWSSLVAGVQHGPDWLRVEDRFLPMTLQGVPVLTLLDPEDDECSEMPFDDDDSNYGQEDDEADDDIEEEDDAEEFKSQPTQGTQVTQATEITVYTHVDEVSDIDSDETDESDNDGLWIFDWEKLRQRVRDACIRLWLASSVHLVGSHGNLSLKPGMVAEERYQRVVKAVRMSTQTVIGSSIAGFIVGLAFFHLSMTALGRIRLAIFCVSISLPHAALVIVPTLVLLGFGPTRTWRVALVRFCDWCMAGKPARGSPLRKSFRASLHGHAALLGARRPTVARPNPEARGKQVRMTMMQSMSEGTLAESKSKIRQSRMPFVSSALKPDLGESGEIAACVLGFPFNIGINTIEKDVKTTKAAARKEKATPVIKKANEGEEFAMQSIWSTSFIGCAPAKGRN